MIDESDAGEQRIEFDATRAAVYDDEVSEYAIYDEIALFPFSIGSPGKDRSSRFSTWAAGQVPSPCTWSGVDSRSRRWTSPRT